MSRRCRGPSCHRRLHGDAVACDQCFPLIPAAIREDLARADAQGVAWSLHPLWTRSYGAAMSALDRLQLRRAQSARQPAQAG